MNEFILASKLMKTASISSSFRGLANTATRATSRILSPFSTASKLNKLRSSKNYTDLENLINTTSSRANKIRGLRDDFAIRHFGAGRTSLPVAQRQATQLAIPADVRRYVGLNQGNNSARFVEKQLRSGASRLDNKTRRLLQQRKILEQNARNAANTNKLFAGMTAAGLGSAVAGGGMYYGMNNNPRGLQ